MIARGLPAWSTLPPGVDALTPWLPAALRGRQSACTVHFIHAWTLVLFVLVHAAMVLMSGVFNDLSARITGRYVIATAAERE